MLFVILKLNLFIIIGIFYVSTCGVSSGRRDERKKNIFWSSFLQCTNPFFQLQSIERVLFFSQKNVSFRICAFPVSEKHYGTKKKYLSF